KTQAEFIARGLAGLAAAPRTGVFYTTDDIQKLMRTKLEKAKARKSAQQKCPSS
ncbi:prevent-host-death protein, partial [Rhizobium johnstonii]